MDAFLATLWGMIGGPIIWVFVTPLFDGQGPNAIFYSLGTAMALSMMGFAATSRFIRRSRA